MSGYLFDNVVIIGVGFVGGSMGLALKRRDLARKVRGIGPNREGLERAMAVGAIDSYTLDLKGGVVTADLVIVATPVGMIVPVVDTIAPFLKRGAVVTDMGSVKSEIARKCDEIMREGTYFVGGHPMIKSDKTGAESASANAFLRARYIITPTLHTAISALTSVTALVESLGASCELMDPDEHDRTVAIAGHLPHVMSAALLHTFGVSSINLPKLPEMTAASFDDMTRASESSAEYQRDICLTNSAALTAVIDDCIGNMERLKDMIAREDGKGLREFFDRARQIRRESEERKPR